jgi:hypothetical protein
MSGKPKKHKQGKRYFQTYILGCPHCGKKVRGVENIRESGRIVVNTECLACGRSGRL